MVLLSDFFHKFKNKFVDQKYYNEDSRINKLLRRIVNEKQEKDRRIFSLKNLLDYLSNYTDSKKVIINILNGYYACKLIFF